MTRLSHSRLAALSEPLGMSASQLQRYAAQPSGLELLGELYDLIFGSGSGSTPRRGSRQLRLADIPAQLRGSVQALQSLTGETLRLPSGRAPQSRRVVNVPVPGPGGRGNRGGSAAPPTAPAPQPQPESEPPGGFSSRRSPADTAQRTLPYQPIGRGEEQPYFSDEFHAPTSSNVYSFQFFRRPRDTTGILYVTYKAAAISGVSKGAPRHRGGRRQLRGTPGKTVSGSGDRPHVPGPTYAYYNVPANVFTRMKNAYSKGKFIWDVLRVRGTVFGHRYNYGLVVGQLVTDSKGEYVGQYVPRKATAKGFRTRSVADMGLGRRSFTSSTLPAKSFRTRSAPGGKTR